MVALQVNGAEHELRNAQPWPSPADPGDLSRRIVQRRAELKLSVAQVAERARISRRYLEYLESFPARPSTVTLRRLAAALRTTPAALLGGGGNVPPGRRLPVGGQVERLFPAECRRLIAAGGIGRIALVTASGPLALPVNFAVVADTLVIRTDPGSTIGAHATDSVAFEVDHIDEALGQGWSVLVRGQAHPVLQPAERHQIAARTDLQPWPMGEHELYVRIVPYKITGRRIAAQ